VENMGAARGVGGKLHFMEIRSMSNLLSSPYPPPFAQPLFPPHCPSPRSKMCHVVTAALSFGITHGPQMQRSSEADASHIDLFLLLSGDHGDVRSTSGYNCEAKQSCRCCKQGIRLLSSRIMYMWATINFAGVCVGK